MKKYFALLVLLVSYSALASEPYGDHPCSALIDGSGDQIYIYDAWISGFQAGRLGYEKITRENQNLFIAKVSEFCVLLPNARMKDAVESVLKARL